MTGKTVGVLAEPCRAHDAVLQLLLTADPDLQRGQSFPGSACVPRDGTETRSRRGSHRPVSQPPYTQPVSRPTEWGRF